MDFLEYISQSVEQTVIEEIKIQTMDEILNRFQEIQVWLRQKQ